MHNDPFNNPFKCSLKKKDANNTNITISKIIELELDPLVVIKRRETGEIISLNDLQPKDRLEIIVSPTEPHKVIEIELLVSDTAST